MKFLNHSALKVEKHKEYNEASVFVGSVILGDLAGIRRISEKINETVSVKSEEPFLLLIKTSNDLNAETRLLLYNLALYANTKSDVLTRNEARLTIPEAIKNDKCAEVPLKKLINGTPYKNIFQVRIESPKKAWRLY